MREKRISGFSLAGVLFFALLATAAWGQASAPGGGAGSGVASGFFYFLMGLGLAACAGFRVFVPLLVVGLGVKAGAITIQNPMLEWIGSWPAIIVFGVAALLEICAYYIPWLDNLLDTLALPASAVAGAILMASCLRAGPLVTWVVSIVAGGGTSLAVQASTTCFRAVSSTTTGGIANPLLSTGELAASAGGSVISILLPVLAVLVAAGFVAVVWLLFMRLQKRRAAGGG